MGLCFVFLMIFCRDTWLGFYPRISEINGKVMHFGLRSQAWQNIFTPVSEPEQKKEGEGSQVSMVQITSSQHRLEMFRGSL